MTSFRGSRLFSLSLPVSSVWLLTDIAEAKGRQGLYARQAPQLLAALRQTALGFPVLDDGLVVGHMQFFDQDFLAALNVVDALVSLPGDLAWVIDAAGGLALDHAGKIALERALA